MRQVARRDRQARFTALMHHVDLGLLWRANREVNPNASPGVDRVTWQEYGIGLEARLGDLLERVQADAIPRTTASDGIRRRA